MAKTIKKVAKRKNVQDATLKNINALKRRVRVLETVASGQADALDSIEIGVRSVLANVQSLLEQLQTQTTTEPVIYRTFTDAEREALDAFDGDDELLAGDYEGTRGPNGDE